MVKGIEINVPIWEKFSLSIEEAAAYFGIGENSLRKLISRDKDASYILRIGTRTRVKRQQLEQFLADANEI